MIETILIIILILCNGFFALSEIALVSSRHSKLQEMAQNGSKHAQLALALKVKPEKFLSAIQVGITMIGVISGMVGGLALAKDFEPLFNVIIPQYAYELSLVMVVSVITYLSILVGELLPKTIALQRPESIVVIIVPVIRLVALVFRPVVSILSLSTNAMLTLFRIAPPPETGISENELKILIHQIYREGSTGQKKFELYDKLFRLISREAIHLMKHRTEMIWIDINDTEEKIHQLISMGPYNKFIVCEGALDHVIGVLSVKDYLILPGSNPRDIRSIVKEPVFVPVHADAIKIIELFQEQKCSLAIVVDEYGSVQGMITAQDLLYQTLGVISESHEYEEPNVIQRSDGSFLVDGQIQFDELLEIIPDLSRHTEEAHYTTLAGYFNHHFGRLPKTGDFFVSGSYRYEVVDMDGLRIDKFLVQKIM